MESEEYEDVSGADSDDDDDDISIDIPNADAKFDFELDFDFDFDFDFDIDVTFVDGDLVQVGPEDVDVEDLVDDDATVQVVGDVPADSLLVKSIPAATEAFITDASLFLKDDVMIQQELPELEQDNTFMKTAGIALTAAYVFFLVRSYLSRPKQSDSNYQQV